MAAPEWTHYHEKKRKSVTRLKDRESFIFNFHNTDSKPKLFIKMGKSEKQAY